MDLSKLAESALSNNDEDADSFVKDNEGIGLLSETKAVRAVPRMTKAVGRCMKLEIWK